MKVVKRVPLASPKVQEEGRKDLKVDRFALRTFQYRWAHLGGRKAHCLLHFRWVNLVTQPKRDQPCLEMLLAVHSTQE